MNRAFTKSVQAITLIVGCQMLFACKTMDLMTKKVGGESADKAVAEASPVVERQQMKVHDEHFIPKQQYDSQGNEIPYVAEPNPYLENQKPVDKKTRSEFDTALKLLKAGKLDVAQKQFESMAETHPKLSGIWVQLARIHETKGDLTEAEKALQKAIDVNKHNMAAYNALALVYRKQGKFDAAQDAYMNALEQWPDFAEAHYNLGVLYDLYFNNALAAQKHFEAYHFLTGSDNKKVAKWLVELKRRSGVEKSFVYDPPVLLASKPVAEDAAQTSEAL